MKSNKPEIIRLVQAAKKSSPAADQLIQTYMPFIKSETAKFINRAPIEGTDDELIPKFCHCCNDKAITAHIMKIALTRTKRSFRISEGSFLKYIDFTNPYRYTFFCHRCIKILHSSFFL